MLPAFCTATSLRIACNSSPSGWSSPKLVKHLHGATQPTGSSLGTWPRITLVSLSPTGRLVSAESWTTRKPRAPILPESRLFPVSGRSSRADSTPFTSVGLWLSPFHWGKLPPRKGSTPAVPLSHQDSGKPGSWIETSRIGAPSSLPALQVLASTYAGL